MSELEQLVLSELDRYGDLELLGMVRLLPQDSRVGELACELLVDRYRSLVKVCVKRYESSPELHEDLMQVGYVGLLRAINDFDPAIGRGFAAYAKPCISGEIKRHFRDKRFPVYVPQPTQELRLKMRQARLELDQRLSRPPGDRQLARHLGLSDAELLDAQRAEIALHPLSLDAPLSAVPDAASVRDTLGGEDPQLEHTLDIQAVWSHMGELPVREQRLLMMRFYGNMTQKEIGQRLGVSQMHVSRLLAHALGYLRERVFGEGPMAGHRARKPARSLFRLLHIHDPHGSFAVAADGFGDPLENLLNEAETARQSGQVEHLEERHGGDEQPERRLDQPRSNS